MEGQTRGSPHSGVCLPSSGQTAKGQPLCPEKVQGQSDGKVPGTIPGCSRTPDIPPRGVGQGHSDTSDYQGGCTDSSKAPWECLQSHLGRPEKYVLGDLNPRLTDMADEDEQYREAPPNLFGDGFAKKAKERDKELKALQKATSHSRPYQKTDSRAPQAGKDRFFSREPPFHIHREGRQLQRLFPRQETAQKPPIPAERKRAREETKQQSVTKRLKTVTKIDTVHKVVLPVIAHVYPSLPLVLPILSKEKFLKNIAASTIVKQLNVLEIQDIAHRNACQNLPLAGRISHFIYNWEVITKDA